MCGRRNRRQCRSGLETSNIAYWTIRLMHDNPLLPLVRNPYKLLKAAGLEEGQKVIEVGCGPGFFTIPAARIVGDEGHVYAVEVPLVEQAGRVLLAQHRGEVAQGGAGRCVGNLSALATTPLRRGG